MNRNTFQLFLKNLGVKHTRFFSDQYFNEHPEKYNMFGLSSMLSDYGIPNAGLKLADENQIYDIGTPFIAHLGDDFAVVNKVSDTHVRFIRTGKKMTLSLAEFNKIWTRKVLIAEPDENSLEPDYWSHLRESLFQKIQQLYILLFILCLLSYFFISQQTFSLGIISLGIINLAGLYICYLLILKQMNVQSAYADKICSLFKQSDCNNILESDAAKLWGVWGLSEIGFGYFLSNIIAICFFPQLISSIAIINVFSLPVTLWSVWYQKFKAHQWCPLCLIVMVVLWAIFITNIFCGFINLKTIDILALFIMACGYLFFIFSTSIVVQLLTKSQKTENIRYEINSLKANKDVFIALLNKQSYHETSRESSRILFGNPNSDFLVTVFSNPHCEPCSKMHERINWLLENNKNICVQYIFASFSKELEISNRFLIGIYQQKNETAHEVYNLWFKTGKMNKEAFFEEYKIDTDLKEVLDECDLHMQWKEQSGLSATPTILINGYKLPDYYKIEDLRYF